MISYLKLRLEMTKRGMPWKVLIEGAKITQFTARKLKRDEYVELETLVKIGIFLDLDIGHICEIKKDPSN